MKSSARPTVETMGANVAGSQEKADRKEFLRSELATAGWLAGRDKCLMKFSRCTFPTGFAVALLNAFSPPLAHASDVANRVSVIRVPGASNVIKAQSGADGTIHLLFDGEDGPFYARSQDDGRTFSASIAIVDASAKKPGLKF